MLPKSDMAAREARVRLEKREVEGSWRYAVIVDDEEIGRMELIRHRYCNEARREQITKYVETSAHWPPDAELKNLDAWDAVWRAAKGLWEHPRKGKGGMASATARSTLWRGTLPLDDMKQFGSSLVKQACDEGACKKLEAVVLGAEGKQRTHAGSMDFGVRSIQLYDADEAAEIKAFNRRQSGTAALGPGSKELKKEDLGALMQIRGEVAEAAGMPPISKVMPNTEGLTMTAGLHPAQNWHGDGRGIPVLAAVVGLSEKWVPPYFPSITKDWGEGGDIRASAVPGTSTKKKDSAEVHDKDVLLAREMRWRRVHESGENGGEHVATENWAGAELGLSATGLASAVPRTTMFKETNRRRGGARPTLDRGDVVYFDATGPHRGPGVALGEAGGRRTVLYVTWCKHQDAKDGGAPVFAFPPEGAAKEMYHLAFDAKGEYTYDSDQPPIVGKKRRMEGAAALVAAKVARTNPLGLSYPMG